MDTPTLRLPLHHQAFIDRFIAACVADTRIVAAFLGGSYAKGTADAHSDLDLCVITTDAAFDEFFAEREVFVRHLGDLLFLEQFNLPNLVFLLYADGVEGELWFASEHRFDHIQCGPYVALFDPSGFLAGKTFPQPVLEPAEQTEAVRSQVTVFWHDMSHFVTALARGQHWWAHGQLEELRGICMNLALLHHNAANGAEGFWKIDKVLSDKELAPLRATYGFFDRDGLIGAADTLIRYYQDLAHSLVLAHNLEYPFQLERVLLERLEEVRA